MKTKKDFRLDKNGVIKKGTLTKFGFVQSYDTGLYIVETDDNGSTYQFEHAELFPLPTLKAIIIENEYDVPNELQGFIKDNEALFESVDKQIACLHRPFEDVARFIPKADAVIVMSTWMYKDQLEKFVDAFANQKFGKTFKFYIHPYFRSRLNEWNEKDKQLEVIGDSTDKIAYKQRHHFDDILSFIANIKKLVSEQEVYEIMEDRSKEETIKDGLAPGVLADESTLRRPYIAERIMYDVDKDEFVFKNKNL